nr:venom protein 302-like isoform X2 [Procambarus clarkii]
MNTFTIFSLLCLVIASCSGLRCFPCEQRSTPCPDPSTLSCPWGTVKDICYCCDICGKGPGEECGGMWNMFGKCGRCLVCKKESEHAKGTCVPGGC